VGKGAGANLRDNQEDGPSNFVQYANERKDKPGPNVQNPEKGPRKENFSYLRIGQKRTQKDFLTHGARKEDQDVARIWIVQVWGGKKRGQC